MEFDLQNIIMSNIKQLVSSKIDEEIKKELEIFEKELEIFERKLLDRKDQYLSEIMKSIRMYHETNDMENIVNYKIIFENIYKIEK